MWNEIWRRLGLHQEIKAPAAITEAETENVIDEVRNIFLATLGRDTGHETHTVEVLLKPVISPQDLSTSGLILTIQVDFKSDARFYLIRDDIMLIERTNEKGLMDKCYRAVRSQVDRKVWKVVSADAFSSLEKTPAKMVVNPYRKLPADSHYKPVVYQVRFHFTKIA